LALSDPPYYTACPNPFLEDFIRYYGKPYKPDTDYYRREPFAADVSEGKNDPIYNAHSYHTKVPHKAIMRYILHYTEPGDIVFDGFCGTGMTGVAAQLCGDTTTVQSLGYQVQEDGTILNALGEPFSQVGERRSVLNDISPLATFLARNYNSPPDVMVVEETASKLLNEARKLLGHLYKTSLHGRVVDISHTVYSDIFLCSNCGNEVIFWNVAVNRDSGKIQDEFNCPYCQAVLRKRELDRAQEMIFDPNLGQTVSRGKQVPVLIQCKKGKNRVDKIPDSSDLELILECEEEVILDWYPIVRIDRDIGLWYERNYRSLGVYSIDNFFTKRNLRTIAFLWKYIESISSYPVSLGLKFALTGMQVNLSRMNRWRHNVSFPYNPLSGTLYIGSLPVESNVITGLENKISRLVKVWRGCRFSKNKKYLISTNSSSGFKGFLESSVDYIFTDPPFGSNIIYSDLNLIWESWLKVSTNTDKEAVIHRRKKDNAFTLENYTHLMASCFAEMYRVLKPGRWITVEFHNTKNSIWNAIQESLQQAGFVIADVRILDKQLQTFKQATAVGSVKQDLVISAYKPNGGLEKRFKLEAGTEEGAWDFVQTHLKQVPVFVAKDEQAEVIAERQDYLLYDRMVAFHIQRGVMIPLSAAEFYAGLEQRFEKRDGMYFLPEQVLEYDRKRHTVREFLQLELLVTDEESAIQWVRQQLTRKPQTLQELTPKFMKEGQRSWAKHERLFELRELLEDNFPCYKGNEPIPPQIVSWLKESSIYRELINGVEANHLTDAGLETQNAILLNAAVERWYVPNPDRARDLELIRDQKLLREFEQYRQSNQRKLKQFRTEAIRAGFKKCWQERTEEGYRTIVDIAHKIPETILQEDPKLFRFYNQAVTRLGGI